MQAVNKKMDPQKTLQTMQNFQKETAKMEMTEEMSEYSSSIINAFKRRRKKETSSLIGGFV